MGRIGLVTVIVAVTVWRSELKHWVGNFRVCTFTGMSTMRVTKGVRSPVPLASGVGSTLPMVIFTPARPGLTT